MKHVLKYSLMAMMLCGFAGHAAAATQTEGKIRVAVEFDPVTGLPGPRSIGPEWVVHSLYSRMQSISPRSVGRCGLQPNRASDVSKPFNEGVIS